MTLTINGEDRRLESPVENVTQLLAVLDLDRRPVLVELNGEALLPRQFADSRLSDGDRLEIVRVVAGG